jgi:hypothetical protein
MRVLADTGDARVLYLAAETPFQAARSPDGGPVRDLDDWVSGPQTWTGGSLVRIVPRERWYAVDLEYDAKRAFTGYYVNFQEPLRATTRGFDTVDLVLDIEVDPALAGQRGVDLGSVPRGYRSGHGRAHSSVF